MDTLQKNTIGEFVAQDFRTAALFSKYKIDFCCKGNKTLDEVCEAKGLDVNKMENEINAVLNTNSSSEIDFKSFSPNLLIDYILETHHEYIESKTPVLLMYLDKLCKVHGERHPELFEINNLFKIASSELLNHLQKEEVVLFPFIKTMTNAIKNNETIQQPGFGTVENPIAMLKQDHETEGDLFVKISALTNEYDPPINACETYKVTFAMLKEYEQDLHKHIHLENNILFHKAVELEERFNVLD
ncbi:iron-sulfur cluster repair di-iron protein [Flavobacterium sp. SUN046]|nr:iron-sulfur cluster repair di-iron protein [Flavobacterium sp. SUN046]MEC4050770.1 iron-sulfur cluster repair di-iron protein [Flavobacterium sp. SUN046]